MFTKLAPSITSPGIADGDQSAGKTIFGGLFFAVSISTLSSSLVTSKAIGIAKVSESRPSLTSTVIVALSGILASPSALNDTTPEFASITKMSFDTDCKDQLSLSPSGSTALNTDIILELSLTSR